MSKIDELELSEINELRTKLAIEVSEVGNLTLQSKLLQDDVRELQDTIEQKTLVFKDLLEQEKQLVKRLSEKYGIGSIDFETGEFTPEK